MNIITPAVNWITEWSVVVTVVVIVALFVYGIISYIKNRHKPDSKSDEVKAIKELTNEIKGMRQDFRDRG